MPYSLKFDDRQSKVSLTPSLSFDPILCESGFIVLGEGLNRLELAVTAEQFKKLFSSMMVGSELLWPNDNQDLQALLLQAASCPIGGEDAGCIEYLPSASFIKFFPDNPYVDGDKASGWNKEVWWAWPQFDTLFPDWLDNWLNGAISSLTNYQATDILFNAESLPINPIDAFINGGGILPKIEIKFTGTGSIDLTLLSFPLGGKAIIELDQEPNALDILTGGLLDPAAFIVELNRDVLNFPPDEYPIVQIPLEVTTAGNHTLYIVFIPIVDDALIPIGFGGGFRSIEFCGFPEQGTMGIEQIVWNGCELVSITGGIETTVVTAAQIEACLNIPSGGGGGGLLAKTLTKQIASNITINTLAYSQYAGFNVAYTPTKSKMLVVWSNISCATPANARLWLKMTCDGAFGVYGNEAQLFNSGGSFFSISEVFQGLTGAPVTLGIQAKYQTGFGFINANISYDIHIIEFDEGDGVFVEDIRIVNNELEKKIAGVWLPVSDSLATILNSIQSTASSALVQAAAANTQANAAYSLAQTADNKASSAQAVNTSQNTRLNDLEADMATAQNDIISLNNAVTAAVNVNINQNNQLSSLDSRIDILEAATGGSSWAGWKLGFTQDISMSPASGRYYSADNTFFTSSPAGWESSGNPPRVEISVQNANRFGAAMFAKAGAFFPNGTPFTIRWRVMFSNDAWTDMNILNSNGITQGWVKIPNVENDTLWLEFEAPFASPFAKFRINNFALLYLNINPYTGELVT